MPHAMPKLWGLTALSVNSTGGVYVDPSAPAFSQPRTRRFERPRKQDGWGPTRVVDGPPTKERMGIKRRHVHSTLIGVIWSVLRGG